LIIDQARTGGARLFGQFAPMIDVQDDEGRLVPHAQRPYQRGRDALRRHSRHARVHANDFHVGDGRNLFHHIPDPAR
jgi:hypothetical protein